MSEFDTASQKLLVLPPPSTRSGNDAVPLVPGPSPRIVERFRQTAPGRLIDEMTFSDPDVYAASWIEMRTYRYRADLRLQEFVCQENNRNVDPTNGATTSK